MSFRDLVDLSSGEAGCSTVCGGAGATCSDFLSLLTCDDLSSLGCACGDCCVDNYPVSPPPPYMPPSSPLVGEQIPCTNKTYSRNLRALTRCTTGSSTRQDNGPEVIQVADGPGLSIVLAAMLTAAGAYATYLALRRAREKWQARSLPPSQSEAEVSGVTLQTLQAAA